MTEPDEVSAPPDGLASPADRLGGPDITTTEPGATGGAEPTVPAREGEPGASANEQPIEQGRGSAPGESTAPGAAGDALGTAADASGPTGDALGTAGDASGTAGDALGRQLTAALGGELAPRLSAALEASLLVSDAPLTTESLAIGLRIPVAAVEQSLRKLAAEYEQAERGFRLRETATGWRLFAATEFTELVQRLLLDERPARLTQAALETLAVVAYRQPVSRARVAAVRGVSVDAVIRTLLQRGLVREVATEEGTGAVLFGTTALFLERLGIRDLSELPDLGPLLPGLSDPEDFETMSSTA
ncbi:MAG TPA: SMC-Scp complex subunit ScpB [Mycobacteriales bacterium]|nr:SMC-Scp complex subunit ScpB [Mycobacteriales bacterium]